jgi:hypothetical protein
MSSWMNVARMLEPIMDPIEKLVIANTLKDVVVDGASIGFKRSRASLLCLSDVSKRNGPYQPYKGRGGKACIVTVNEINDATRLSGKQVAEKRHHVGVQFCHQLAKVHFPMGPGPRLSYSGLQNLGRT